VVFGWSRLGRCIRGTAFLTLNKAIDLGVNFIDTADVYGDGRSEKLIGKFLKTRKEKIYVATKAGRRLNPHLAQGYTKKNLNNFVDRSLQNLGVESLDLLQLHCPPPEVYFNPEVFEILDGMVQNKKIKFFGVSVEKIEEALTAMEHSDVSTIQIIFNMFRQKPAELFLEKARKKNVGVIIRVPLASGLLSGKMTKILLLLKMTTGILIEKDKPLMSAKHLRVSPLKQVWKQSKNLKK